MAKHYKEKSKKINKSKIGNLLWLLMMLVFITLFVISTIKIVKWYLDNKENEKILGELLEVITVNEEKEKIEDKYEVDFNKLKEKNPDTIAFLKVNGTNIEMPVVKTNSNEYYLNHNFNKQYNSAGWIFTDYRNKLDGTDRNIIIYGHNMQDNSMFGSLKNILKKEWYDNEDNYEILLITENGCSIYKVFSIYQIEKEDYYIQTNFKTNTVFAEFIKTIQNRSVKNFDIKVTSEDNILTLSTCANNNKYRVVLHAKELKK